MKITGNWLEVIRNQKITEEKQKEPEKEANEVVKEITEWRTEQSERWNLTSVLNKSIQQI